MNRDFKGVFISLEDIQKYGTQNAALINGFKQGAPNLNKYEIRKVKKILGIKIIDPEEIKKQVLSSKNKYICLWCKNPAPTLEEHHFPISRKNNGIEVVKICPNCHRLYHQIEYHGIIRNNNGSFI